MRVLHVIESLGRGGAEGMLLSLLPELSRQGAYVSLAVRGGSMDLAPDFEARGVRLFFLRRRHRWNLLGMAREIAKLAANQRVQVVHAHLYFPAVAVSLMRVLHLFDARTCVTFHNLAYGGANAKTVGLAVRRRLASWLYPRGIHRAFAVSSAVAFHYQETLGLERISVLPNPVDLRRIRELASSNSTSVVRGSACRIVVPGRIVFEKGHSDLVKALATLADRGLRPEVIIAGDGPLHAEIEAQSIAEGLSRHVRFAGAQKHRNLMVLLGSADIVVVPSRFEGFGLTALEAMALGKAVVATEAGGLPETVGDAGLLVPVSDPPALAAAIEALLDDPAQRMALGSSGIKRAKRFDLPGIAARHIKEYKALCASRFGTDP